MKVIAYLSRCNVYFTPDMFTCQELSSYGKNDSSLVITGPVDRDEHWHRVARATQLKLRAEVEPLMFHKPVTHLIPSRGDGPRLSTISKRPQTSTGTFFTPAVPKISR